MIALLIRVWLLFEAPRRWWGNLTTRIRREYYLRREPPWMDIGDADPWGEAACEHNIGMISRHSIAEAGAQCEDCRKEMAARGDFSGVRRTRLGEAIVCEGCGNIYVAHPDTEHGDHEKTRDELPLEKENVFVRIPQEQALREKWGEDLDLTDTGGISTTAGRQPQERHSIRRLLNQKNDKSLFGPTVREDEVSVPAAVDRKAAKEQDWPSEVHISDTPLRQGDEPWHLGTQPHEE